MKRIMYIINETPYIINANTLHVFRFDETLQDMRDGIINLSSKSISSMKIYAFSNLVYCDNDVFRKHFRNMDEMYNGINNIIQYWYKNNHHPGGKPVVIVKTSQCDDILIPICSLIERELSIIPDIPKIKSFGVDRFARSLGPDSNIKVYSPMILNKNHRENIGLIFHQDELIVMTLNKGSKKILMEEPVNIVKDSLNKTNKPNLSFIEEEDLQIKMMTV